MRILIIGGYGTFGGRLARLLAGDSPLALLIAGRSANKAADFARTLQPGAEREPVVFDRDGDVAGQIAALAPDLVVDASGPWQAYGSEPYRVVTACIELGIDYCDLADGSDFVNGVVAFDAAAKAQGVTVLSGVSTCPVLTAAAVRRLARDLDCVDQISAGIAPSPYAGVGLNVVRAIAAYAGRPVRVRSEGRERTLWGLMDRRRRTIAVPGGLPLDCRLFSLVDVPDLEVLARAWPEARSVWLGAGPVPEVLHRALSLLAWAPRLGLVRSLEPLAPLFHWATNRLRWGAARGGMFVAVEGVRDGRRVERVWCLTAEGDDGPFIPSVAVAALVRRRLDGQRAPSGARACVDEVELEDYAPLFGERAIDTGVWERGARGTPLYRRVLGPAFDRLAPPLLRLHDAAVSHAAEGRASVERGSGPLAALIGGILRLPQPGEDVAVRVDFALRDGVETWTRTFAGRAFASTQEEGEGLFQRLLVERFGPIAFGLALVVEGERLRLVVKRWTVLGLAMPRRLAPVGDASEGPDAAGRFSFDVEIALPLVGRIVRYRGWLEPVNEPGS